MPTKTSNQDNTDILSGCFSIKNETTKKSYKLFEHVFEAGKFCGTKIFFPDGSILSE